MVAATYSLPTHEYDLEARPPVEDALELRIAGLLAMPIHKLRRAWESEHSGQALPDRLPRDLLVRSIAWKWQCEEGRGPSKSVASRLDELARQLAVSGTIEIERSVRPKIGTRLIREWRGKTFVVEVTEQGFEHDGQIYASLSHAARAITGTRWSGPRFFGLKGESR